MGRDVNPMSRESIFSPMVAGHGSHSHRLMGCRFCQGEAIPGMPQPDPLDQRIRFSINEMFGTLLPQIGEEIDDMQKRLYDILDQKVKKNDEVEFRRITVGDTEIGTDTEDFGDYAIDQYSGELVAYWKLDEASGSGTRVDSVGNNDMVPWFSTADAAAGKRNNAFKGTGTADQKLLKIPYGSDLNPTSAFAMSLWFYQESSGAAWTMMYLDGSTYLQADGGATVQEIRWVGKTTGVDWNARMTGETIPKNAWHNLLCVASAGTAYIYLDGVLKEEDAYTGSISFPGVDWQFGGSGNYTWQGRVDEVAMWKDLSFTAGKSDIDAFATALYASGSGSFWLSTGSSYIEVESIRQYDTDKSHFLHWVVGSDLTADRDLKWITGDADRTITLEGDPTLDDWFDQAVKSTSSPTFQNVVVTSIMSATTIAVAELNVSGNSTFGGTGHDSFSDFLTDEHINWKGARVFHVGMSGDNMPYTSVKTALDAAAAVSPTATNPSVVYVHPGYYDETGITSAYTLTAYVHLVGVSRHCVTIEAAVTGDYVFYIPSNSTLQHVTVNNDHATNPRGVCILNASNAHLIDVETTSNTAGAGYGISSYEGDSTCTIRNCRSWDTSFRYGSYLRGAVEVHNSQFIGARHGVWQAAGTGTPDMIGCIVWAAAGYAAMHLVTGIQCWRTTIHTYTGNTDGVYMDGATAEFYDCIIKGNGTGDAIDGVATSTCTLSNCSINGTLDTGNITFTYGDAYQKNVVVSGTLGVTGIATLGDASTLATSAAPTLDAQIANRKFVTDQVAAAGGGFTWVQKAVAYTCVDHDGILMDSTGGAFTLTLPLNPTGGEMIAFCDAGSDCSTNNVTIARNGQSIQGVAQDLLIDFDDASFALVFDATYGWRLDPFYGDGAGMSSLVDDLSPQLGGDLDLNGKNIDFPSTPNISDVATTVGDPGSDTTLVSEQGIREAFDTTNDAMSTPIYFNMLTIAPDVVGQGTWVRVVNAASLYDGVLYNTTHNDGDNWTVNFRCPAGTYTLRFNILKNTDVGVVDIYFDGGEEDSIDPYAAAADYVYVHETSGVVLTAGAHTLKFQIDGKNGASSDHYMYFGPGISLQRTS